MSQTSQVLPPSLKPQARLWFLEPTLATLTLERGSRFLEGKPLCVMFYQAVVWAQSSGIRAPVQPSRFLRKA